MAQAGPATQVPAHLFGTYPVRPRWPGVERLALPFSLIGAAVFTVTLVVPAAPQWLTQVSIEVAAVGVGWSLSFRWSRSTSTRLDSTGITVDAPFIAADVTWADLARIEVPRRSTPARAVGCDGRRLTLPGLPAAVVEELHAWTMDAAAPPPTPST